MSDHFGDAQTLDERKAQTTKNINNVMSLLNFVKYVVARTLCVLRCQAQLFILSCTNISIYIINEVCILINTFVLCILVIFN